MAAIKMDELLVSWLSSDGVYESVLNLVETHRSSTSTNNGSNPSGGGSPTRTGGKKQNGKGTISGDNDDIPAPPPTGGIDDDTMISPPPLTNRKGAGAGGMLPPTSPRSPTHRTANANTGNTTTIDDKENSDGNSSIEGVEGGSPMPATPVTIPKFYNPQEGGRGRGRRPPPEDRQSWSDVSATNPVLRQVFTSGRASTPTPGGQSESESDVGAAGAVAVLPSDDPSLVLSMAEFLPITKEVCNFPGFFNAPLYGRILSLCGGDDSATPPGEGRTSSSTGPTNIDGVDGSTDAETAAADALNQSAHRGVSYGMFEEYWKKEMEPYDAHDRFFRLVRGRGSDCISREDFLPFIEELLASHPGLEFLSNHAEFQEKYAVTVITRIFYCVNRQGGHNGKITSRQVRRSNLLDSFHLVDAEEDINKVTQYFSYEHFYVLYCRFWELDHDRDYLITREDLLKYGDHSLSHMIVDRIFDAAPRPFESSSIANAASAQQDGEQRREDGDGVNADSNGSGGTINREYLSYEDFIYFMLSEEDKANEISVRYWFACVDVDGDGRLNNMEMRSFYAVQLHRMQCLGHEIVPFEDMLCQMMDMIKPANPDYLVVEDFLQAECAQVSGALFDALFNLNKYLQFEQRDPFMERQKREDEFDCDWDRFACIDYNRLAMEEEAREEEAMEIDWVTVDDDEDDGDDFNSLGLGGASEAPF